MKNSTKRKRRRARGIDPWPEHIRTFFVLLGYTELYKFDKQAHCWIKLGFFTGRYYSNAIYFLYKSGQEGGIPLDCDLINPGFFDSHGKINTPLIK